MKFGKTSYINAKYKKSIREELIPNGNVIVTLLGPDAKESIDFLLKKGYSNIISYERNKEVYLKQLADTDKRKNFSLSLCYGNIDSAPYSPGVFYDIDYCDSHIKHHNMIKRIQKDFLFTFCVRNTSVDTTVREFLHARQEILVDSSMFEKGKYFITSSRSTYVVMCYRDRAPMVTIKYHE